MESGSDGESIGLVVQHAMQNLSGKAAWIWIIDSDATCYICNYRSLFIEYEGLKIT